MQNPVFTKLNPTQIINKINKISSIIFFLNLVIPKRINNNIINFKYIVIFDKVGSNVQIKCNIFKHIRMALYSLVAPAPAAAAAVAASTEFKY